MGGISVMKTSLLFLVSFVVCVVFVFWKPVSNHRAKQEITAAFDQWESSTVCREEHDSRLKNILSDLETNQDKYFVHIDLEGDSFSFLKKQGQKNILFHVVTIVDDVNSIYSEKIVPEDQVDFEWFKPLNELDSDSQGFLRYELKNSLRTKMTCSRNQEAFLKIQELNKKHGRGNWIWHNTCEVQYPVQNADVSCRFAEDVYEKQDGSSFL